MSSPAEIAVALFDLGVVRYAHVAGAACGVLEWLQFLPAEVEHVWKSRWSIMKVLYFVTRYSPCIDIMVTLFLELGQDFSGQTCNLLFQSYVWSAFLGIVISEVVIVLRTLALYDNARRMKIFLLVLTVAFTTAVVCIAYIFSKSLLWFGSAQPGLHICMAAPKSNSGTSHAGGYIWIAIAVFESVLVLLTLYKGRDFYTRRRDTVGKVTQVVYRDSLRFFVLIAAASITNAVIVLNSTVSLQSVTQVIVRVAHSALTCRVLLNIRGAANEESYGNTLLSPQTPAGVQVVSNLQFARKPEIYSLNDM